MADRFTATLTFVCCLFLVCSVRAEDTLEDQLKTYDRDDIHSIHKKLFTKKGRHEFTLATGGILNHDGWATIGAQYTYHLFENLGIEAANGAMGFQTKGSNKLYLYQASLNFAPLYGKLSLFTWAVVNFDIYVLGGAGVVSYSGSNKGSSFAGNVGLGERFFINEYLSAKVEFRNYMWKQKLLGGTDSEIWNNFALTAGLSVMFPFNQKY
jgi:outer membrane beta-barrel protein